VAKWIGPGGRLDVLDIQQEMLDHLMRDAAAHGLSNIEPVIGDAQRLPYPDASFDGAYLVTVLGEIPDGDAALRELRRVVKPGGRVVFGETPIDPHVVTLSTLRRRADGAGLRYERHTGTALAYFARFTPA
jgi:ubiquinone/menaquinone biosynthesis C-methylase UbiE